MTAQVLFFDIFFKKDPHVNAVESNFHLYLLKYLNIYVFNNIRKTHFCKWIIDIVTTTTTFTYLNTV